eukprot:SAG31_NODE_6305_length_2073_cov_2.623100_1_plen_84_part_00
MYARVRTYQVPGSSTPATDYIGICGKPAEFRLYENPGFVPIKPGFLNRVFISIGTGTGTGTGGYGKKPRTQLYYDDTITRLKI